MIAFSPLPPELDYVSKEVLQIALHKWVLASSESALANKKATVKL